MYYVDYVSIVRSCLYHCICKSRMC